MICNQDFWDAVYVAAIASGKNPADAFEIAEKAVGDRIEMMDSDA